MKILSPFAKWLSGEDFPEAIKVKDERCLYLDLLFRRAVLSQKEGLLWITPQVHEIFLEDANSKDLLKRLK
jgi:hypothetical protein